MVRTQRMDMAGNSQGSAVFAMEHTWSHMLSERSALTKAVGLALVLLILFLGGWAARLRLVGYLHTPQRYVVNNLRVIQNSKLLWANDNKKSTSEVPTERDLAPYFNSGRLPSPVIGETYRINAVGKNPTAIVPKQIRFEKRIVEAGGEVTLDDAH